mmetsp:Transcript_13408/g.15029  ORF Transcript_13408/g.15029 Transcript_13408/m.15029 type:complete len:369 (-) Transcript_13408:610-1716(-)
MIDLSLLLQSKNARQEQIITDFVTITNNENIIYYQEDEDKLSPSPPKKKQRHHRQRQHKTLKRQSYILKMKTLNTKFKKPKKSVRFNFNCNDNVDILIDTDDRDDDTISCRTIVLTNEEIKNSWYDKFELLRFRQKALKVAVYKYNRSNGDDTQLPRGMESLSKKRRRHKVFTLRYILVASNQHRKSPKFVAKLSAKLGQWNNEIAIRDACMDYCEVYHPQLVHTVPPPVSSNPPTISLQQAVSRNSNHNNRNTNRNRNPSAATVTAVRGHPSTIDTTATTRRRTSLPTVLPSASTAPTHFSFTNNKKRGRYRNNFFFGEREGPSPLTVPSSNSSTLYSYSLPQHNTNSTSNSNSNSNRIMLWIRMLN